jgi:hypothetical protein
VAEPSGIQGNEKLRLFDVLNGRVGSKRMPDHNGAVIVDFPAVGPMSPLNFKSRVFLVDVPDATSIEPEEQGAHKAFVVD